MMLPEGYVFYKDKMVFDHMVGHPRCVFINYIWLSIVEHN